MSEGARDDLRPETATGGEARHARRYHIRGVVQGVGFRPFVHRLAERHGLAGQVRNEAGRVFVEVEGREAALDAFEFGLTAEAPPLARIDVLDREPMSPAGRTGFEVSGSDPGGSGRLPVSPDVSMCGPCRAELLDPANRRFEFPFITCTDCGPRYTVIEAMPYDRERTSMRAFSQCPACLEEYRTPADRRYHSETNSCPDCGPAVWLAAPDGTRTARDGDAIDSAAELLRSGGILALRGLGGFHLAVDARDEQAVRRLRDRKGRWEKPLAVMVAELEGAQRLAFLTTVDETLLTSRERPIVLVRGRPGAGLAPSISPGLDTVGIMLAYTPLHLLLLARTGRPLVMTSGNKSELPIATGIEEATAALCDIVDAFLVHDREIVSRYDDSVLRTIGGAPSFVRRSRGYAPLPVRLPVETPEPLLAVGPHLKNTFTLATGREAFVSQHIGDLENLETLEHFHAALSRFRQLFRIEPRLVVCDMHPGYLSTRVAREIADALSDGVSAGSVPVLRVQHHHAHVAAVAAEHGVTGPVVGLSFDGTGYGEDGTVWGAEVLVADLSGYRRAAHLRYAPLPGGDLAVRTPWRAALGYRTLDAGGDGKDWGRAFEDVPGQELRLADRQARRGLNAPLASSMGRLFDAAAAVLGLRGIARYEGQAAMELESLAWSVLAGPARGPVEDGDAIRARSADRGVPELPFPEHAAEGGVRIMDPVPLLRELGRARSAGTEQALLAAAFHLAVADRAVSTGIAVAKEAGLRTAALGGGTFQNAILVPLIRDGLRAAGMEVLVPSALGPNDGAISYGQAAVAAWRVSQQGR